MLVSVLVMFTSSNASRIQILLSVPWPLHFEIDFAGPAKTSINMCSTEMWSTESLLVWSSLSLWYLLVRFITCYDLIF